MPEIACFLEPLRSQRLPFVGGEERSLTWEAYHGVCQGICVFGRMEGDILSGAGFFWEWTLVARFPA